MYNMQAREEDELQEAIMGVKAEKYTSVDYNYIIVFTLWHIHI